MEAMATHSTSSYRVEDFALPSDKARESKDHSTVIEWPVAREDEEIYVPDVISDPKHDIAPEVYDAAEEHARHLDQAEQHVDDALNLSEVLRASIGDAGDERAMHMETVLKLVETRLGKARRNIDKHRTRHLNLFIAYAEAIGGEDR